MAFMGKIFQALRRTRATVADAFDTVVQRKVSVESLEDLEDTLISTDMGIDTVEAILGVVEKNRKEGFLSKVEDYLVSALPESKAIQQDKNSPIALLVVGVNGTGKTTSAAKLAHYYKSMGKKVLLVAADTYRAAAVEQLKTWANRLDVNIVCNTQSQQPSAILFDGLNAAKSQGTDIVIVDTAGRLHTYKNLMIELEKMYRVIESRFPEFKIHSLITLDASLGQNSLIQAREFSNTVQVDGAMLTKMDGTAKGGIVFPLFKELKIPVKFIGVGEDMDDLIVFNRNEYVQGLLGTTDVI
ncbi:MAG: signal recognition particle-docking protein FtsY [Candidatus Marinimicrobia bacterium]|jgi:fused signal recognition particle receptor|nr:signal recognition particle-docking protein FtsY [Candidatus Neomarinimicrobiota bacterium]MBT3946648.1 signal recognition particle-docking protein FtsY [Candidatus Neomarinimicrobiota bacterium]MBT4065565.1 signal recognition particle-docking protein FtsY [Candidatus Neomarinimicrobiota bacterium]MBT4308648.1 signal recognition particle-docking protein FtsY [Candidatus Neomarinimicrobiota bacterium]MBT4453720.1 signal recognition particle-docking protein FtsY [Candidatus Neomarinimicrobiota